MSLHVLIAHFFLVLNNILLFESTTVYLSVHLLKDILVFFQHLANKLFQTSMRRFCVGVSCVNTKGTAGLYGV